MKYPWNTPAGARKVGERQPLPRWVSGCAAALLWAAVVLPARAQQVLVQGNVADDTLKTTFGPNRRYFGHFFVGYALVAGPAEPGAGLRYGPASWELRAGGRLKRRLSQAVALNLDLGYAYLRYSLAQTSQKTVPVSQLHRSESFDLHQVASELSVRLNAGRRGNNVGSYLDLLAGGSWVAATAHRTEDDPAPGVGSVETIEHGLPYLSPWTADLGARLGLDRYAFTARYRVTSAFRPATSWAELPRWRLGLEIGLF